MRGGGRCTKASNDGTGAMTSAPGKVLTTGCQPVPLPHCRAQDDRSGVCGGHGLGPVPRGLCRRGLAHQQVMATFSWLQRRPVCSV